MRPISIIILTSIFFISCENRKKEEKLDFVYENEITEPKSLLENVKLAINPEFEDWVLFENGTYIIFEDISEISDIKNEAIRLMKEFGPVLGGGPAGDFGVTTLNKTEGWVISSHKYGMYTYVNPKELNTSSPSDPTIGLFGRSKRDKDGQNPIIIHVNNAKNN